MNPAISIQVDHATDINFAYVCNGQPIIHSIRITNRSGQDMEDVLLTIACDSKLCESYAQKISILPAGETLTIPDVELKVNAQLLAANLEAETCTLTLRLTCDDRQVAAAEASVHLQEYEHWLGCNKDVKQLAAFIMPNHPDVIRIVAQAARFMEQWTGDPTMAAYLRMPGACRPAPAEHSGQGALLRRRMAGRENVPRSRVLRPCAAAEARRLRRQRDCRGGMHLHERRQKLLL